MVKKKILIVEDEPKISLAYSDHLKHEGYEVEVAFDGEEGLKKAYTFLPDLILLDIAMPKMDGTAMMRKLRQTDEWGKHVSIILLTNFNPDDKEIMESIIEHKPVFYIVKSDFSMEELSEKVHFALNAH